MKRLLALALALCLLCGCAAPDAPAANGDVDVDLTLLSDTVVLSEVADMLNNPQRYTDQVIRMEGTFNVVQNPVTGRYYFTCLIADAMACCAQGFEFVLTEDKVYPQDYPAQGDPIRVVGTFGTYLEEDTLYCQLENARLEEGGVTP